MRISVASFNVQSFRAGFDAAAEALCETLDGRPPDLVFLQESGSRRAVRRFSRTLGMEVVSTHRLFSRVQNALLFGAPWRLAGSPIVRDLSSEPGTHPRGMIAAPLRAGPIRVTAVSTHLGLAGRQREKHAAELTGFLGGVKGPIVMGVDLNEAPEGPATRWIADRLFDGFAVAGGNGGYTFPAHGPAARIDYLFLSAELTATRSWVGTSDRGSDHRPVLAQLEIKEP